jgi:hypothetical protein
LTSCELNRSNFSRAQSTFSQLILGSNINQPGPEALNQIIFKRGHPASPRSSGQELLRAQQHCRLGSPKGFYVILKGFTLKMCHPVSETRHKEVSFCLVDLYAFVVSFLAHAHESYAPTSKRLATLNMPSTDIYARCNFTWSGHPNIRFDVIIKLPKAKLEELRQLPANRDQTDNQLLGSPRRTFSPNCTVVERTGFGDPHWPAIR